MTSMPLTRSSIKSEIDGSAGYTTRLSLQTDELALLRMHVRQSYLNHLKSAEPHLYDRAIDLDVPEYHQLPVRDHKKLWSKPFRILPMATPTEIRKMVFFKALEDEYGRLLITDEEKVETEEVYWRIVRPGAQDDIGPAHADAWFWELGHGEMPVGYKRFKIWMPLWAEPGLNGIAFAAGSHLREDIRYAAETRDNMLKPKILEEEAHLGLELCPLEPGQLVAFHDRLVHKGVLNGGKSCRISLELTCLYLD